MNRSAPLRAKKPWRPERKPIRHRSAKQQKLYDVRVPIIREAMAEGVLCQVGVRIADVDLAAANRCEIRAVDWHEIKTRGRGGSIIDPANRLWACRRCHDWVGAHPRLARLAGIVLNSWDPDPS